MPRKECKFDGCKCKEGLRPVPAALATFCKVLLECEHGWDGFARHAESHPDQIKTYLCEEHWPAGLERGDVLGERVAQIIGGELFFGEVVEICGISRMTRHLEERVAQLLAQDMEDWRYTIQWPAATSSWLRADVLEARELAKTIDTHVNAELTEAARRRERDMDAAWHRGMRAGSRAEPTPRTRFVSTTFSGLLSAMPSGLRRLLPESEPRPDIVGAFTVDTPAGTICHSGGGFIYDVNAHNMSTSPIKELQRRPGWSFENMNESYLADQPELVHDLFGFSSFDDAAHFFQGTWSMDLDESGAACPRTFTAFEEYLFALWRLRQRASLTMLGCFAGSYHQQMSSICSEWIPRCGRAGRSLVWNPSPEFLDRTQTQSFIDAGMGSVGYIGDATDVLSETVRRMISVRNQQHSDKSKASCARGLSWCTQTGFTAMASDLVLGRSSEYNTAVSLAGQFSNVPPRIDLCYDKGVASLRAHLPNLNNVIVPCFLTGGQYSAEQAIRNRAIATNRYVIEVTYSRVKAWKYLSPVVPRSDFKYLNHAWWWALGFANLTCRPLKKPAIEC